MPKIKNHATQPVTPHQHLSDVLEEMALRAADHPLTLADFLRALGVRVYGALIVVFAAPVAFPVTPPGLSTIFALPLLLVLLQMLYNRRQPWLPRRLRRKPVKLETITKFNQFMVPRLRKIEAYVKPRGLFISTPIGKAVIALYAIVLTVFMAMPIPLTNTMPAWALIALGVGLMSRDGLLILLACVLGGVVMGIVSTVFYTAAVAFFS